MDDKLGLLGFMTGCGTPFKILVLEHTEYLAPLRNMFPQAELWCACADKDEAQMPEVVSLSVHWVFVDYLSERLPLEEKYFDYILGEHCLENAANPQDIATGIGLYLKDTGYFLFSFLNIRYWRVIQRLMEGHFYHLASRIFTKDEMIKLMSASFYKDVALLPVRGKEPPQGFVEALESIGFENNNDDLYVESWQFRAAKSIPAILELKRMYTPEIRADLAKLLRRLEYDIDADFNREDLWYFCREQGIFPAYLASFVKEAVMFVNDLLWRLAPWREDAERREFWQELLQELNAAYQITNEDLLLWIADNTEAAYEAGKTSSTVPLSEAYPTDGNRGAVLSWLANRPAPASVEEAPKDAAAFAMPQGTKVAFITCVNNEEVYKEALLYLKHLHLPEGVEAEFLVIREADSMCQGYNLGAANTDAKYKVYIHQDALIVNKNFVFDMLKIFQDKMVGAFGMVGAKNLPASGVWWDGMRVYGRVIHACEPECVMDMTERAPVPESGVEVEAVDGLMIATQVDVPWREDLFTGWHFYEISMCKELQRRGYKVLVPHQRRCWCIHMPKEKPLDATYKIYQKVFLKEYGAELQPEV